MVAIKFYETETTSPNAKIHHVKGMKLDGATYLKLYSNKSKYTDDIWYLDIKNLKIIWGFVK